VVAFAAERDAFAQAGSTGGTVGKTDKSISGATEPEPPARPHQRKPETAQQRRREPPSTAADGTTGCPQGQGSFMSAIEAHNCLLRQNGGNN